MARRSIKIIDAKMSRQNMLGLATIKERKIEIDFSAHPNEKALLDTICHEVLHIASNDFLSEPAVELIAADLADVLYPLKYRRVKQ